MDSTLTPAGMAALFTVMVAGALVPGVSTLTVAARSAAFGLTHGVYTSLGIVLGDIVFIVIAIYGLTVLAGVMGNQFALIKYLGAAYLLWLGVALWRAMPAHETYTRPGESSVLASLLSGLLITLGDQKAILFYLGFFPAFIDLSVVSFLDTGIIIMIAMVAVGGPKLAYAVLANRVGASIKRARTGTILNRVAGSVMIAVGAGLVIVS